MVALAGCDAPPFELDARFFIFEPDGLVFEVDHQPVQLDTSRPVPAIHIQRHYASYEAARNGPPILIEAFRDGASVWKYEASPAVCGGFGSCSGDFIRASYENCIEPDGGPGGLCWSVYCMDDEGCVEGAVAAPAPPSAPN